MTLAQGIEIGPFNFTFIRLLLFIGIIRVVARKELPAGGMQGMDKIMLCWALWALICPAFRTDPSSTLIRHLGMAYNTLGIYFLIRCFCQDKNDVISLIKMLAILLVPLSVEMLIEQFTHRNLFAGLGGVPDSPALRNGRLRSQGPFSHAILAGTVGAVCAPLMLGIWRKHRIIPKLGFAACVLIVICSASSGPLLSLLLSLFAVLLWRWRHLTRQMRIAAIAAYILLEIVMTAPAYYVIAHIDLTGGSTGRHRAALIATSIKHLDEWWWAGTDYTRHWMPVGVAWSSDHVDITNQYIAQGVKGGLPLMILFILGIWVGFGYIGQILRERIRITDQDRFLVWTLGASLFAHATTCISVAYFDQSFVFLFLLLAAISSLRAVSISHSNLRVLPIPTRRALA